jgi:hypothetical protein
MAPIVLLKKNVSSSMMHSKSIQLYFSCINAFFTFEIARVTWIPRGQASMQLKIVRPRHAPSRDSRTSRRG